MITIVAWHLGQWDIHTLYSRRPEVEVTFWARVSRKKGTAFLGGMGKYEHTNDMRHHKYGRMDDYLPYDTPSFQT